VEALAEMLIQRYQKNNQTITLNTTIESTFSLFDTAIPLGLVLHELISNSFKHGFAGAKKGEIRIKMTCIGDKTLCLLYSDNGVGLTLKANTQETELLGFKMVRSIVENQLRGQLTIQDKNGIEVEIRFSNAIYTERV
jgi:two-component sensor histidine kinase